MEKKRKREKKVNPKAWRTVGIGNTKFVREDIVLTLLNKYAPKFIVEEIVNNNFDLSNII